MINKKLLLTLALTATLGACVNNKNNNNMEQNEAVVYMTTDITPEGLMKVYEALGTKPTDSDRVCVKISIGEPGGHHYLDPNLIGPLVQRVKGTIVECNTSYGGARSTTEGHLQAARDHGFCAIAPIDIMDAEGEIQLPVRDTTYLKYDLVGQNLQNYTFMVNIAHFKGHVAGGFGGVLKNQSIGCASQNGKCYQHSTGKWQDLGEFTRQLEQNGGDWFGIMESKDAFPECMAVCAAAVHDYMKGRIVYINVMNNLSTECDCDPNPSAPRMKDIGILASLDPVALDKACCDLVFGHTDSEGDDAQPLRERINERHGTHIIDHAAKIGLGTTKYKIVKL